MKASFDSEQSKVKSLVADGKVYIWICLNGEWTERTYDESQPPERVWECDFAEIIADEGEIDIKDVEAHPESYFDYKPTVVTAQELAEEAYLTAEYNSILLSMLMEDEK